MAIDKAVALFSILQFMDALPAPWFKGLSWEPWRVVLASIFGLPLVDDKEAVLFPDRLPRRMALFTQLTGRTTYPCLSFLEIWLIFGRRAGKSAMCAFVAVYLAVCVSYRQYLAPGERATIALISADRRQSRNLYRYVCGFFDNLTALNALVERRTADAIYLKNGVVIEVHTRSFRTIRGYTIAACICDEIAFWPSDDSSANPDEEILASVRPAMSTIPNARLLCISSPYARRGALWQAHKSFYGVDDAETLVMQAPSRVMNSTLPEKVVKAALARDEASARAEYFGEFRQDIEGYVSIEAIAACVMAGRLELPPMAGTTYTGFVDPSGGSQDSFTLAIAHVEQELVVLDAVREVRPPFSPVTVTEELCILLRAYRIAFVRGDRYAGEWPREQFRKHGVEYLPSEKPKSDLYRDLLPLLNATRVQLLDSPVLLTQLQGLERRTARGGKDSIDHAPNGKDDVANAAAGAIVAVADSLRRRFDAYDPTPDVDAIIPTVVRGDAEDAQEIDRSILRRMTTGGWFER